MRITKITALRIAKPTKPTINIKRRPKILSLELSEFEPDID